MTPNDRSNPHGYDQLDRQIEVTHEVIRLIDTLTKGEQHQLLTMLLSRFEGPTAALRTVPQRRYPKRKRAYSYK